MNLSQRTEEQASSLEEIASKVKNNAENVNKVKEISEGATAAFQTNLLALNTVVEAAAASAH